MDKKDLLRWLKKFNEKLEDLKADSDQANVFFKDNKIHKIDQARVESIIVRLSELGDDLDQTIELLEKGK